MKKEMLDLASDLSRRGLPYVIAKVVRRMPPSSAQVGDTAIITAGGEFHGWLGGSCTRPTVVREARAALGDGKPRLIGIEPDPDARGRPGVTLHPMTCHSGGSVDVYIEPVMPVSRLVIFGVTPVARALARLGSGLGFAADIVDPAAEPEDFPEADRVVHQFEAAGADPYGAAPVVAVVATQGVRDEKAIQEALVLSPKYLGVVASRTRFGEMRGILVEKGIDEATLDRIHCPAGLDLGGVTPEEIALSILAEVVQKSRGGASEAQGADVDAVAEGEEAGTETEPSSAEAPPEPRDGEAIDPVCGMTVEVGGDTPHAEFADEVFWFCCEGCRSRFEEEPEEYATSMAEDA